MANYRSLTQAEINIARNVFSRSIDFSNVFIADTFLPMCNNVAVTVMHEDRGMYNGVPIFRGYWFAIYWGPDVFRKGANSVVKWSNTLIHELTHVWQGKHGIPFGYMINSLLAQGKAIVKYWDRNKAYDYDLNNYVKWSDYNVEQQGNIVEDWFDKNIGNQSTTDPRYTYIEKVIRPGKPYVEDLPAESFQEGIGRISGYSKTFEDNQRLLIKHGYKIKPDGFSGNNTTNAIKDFQRKHNLPITGIFDAKTLEKLK